MTFSSKKQTQRGFTLMEMLIVVAIIAILLAIILPILVSTLENAREVVCTANRRTVARDVHIQEMLRGKPLAISEITALIDVHKDTICPSGGKVSARRLAEGAFEIRCDKHKKSNVYYNPADIVTDFFGDLKPGQYPHSKNDNLFMEYYQKHGWEAFVLDGTTYYAKPYYNENTNEMLVFANTISDDKLNWTASLVCYEGQWYQYRNKYGTLGSTSVANHTWESLQNEVQSKGGTLTKVDLNVEKP